MHFNALRGRAASTGWRQSNPSRRRDSWAVVSATTPPSERGHAKRPFSRRLARRHRPPSHQYNAFSCRQRVACAGSRSWQFFEPNKRQTSSDSSQDSGTQLAIEGINHVVRRQDTLLRYRSFHLSALLCKRAASSPPEATGRAARPRLQPASPASCLHPRPRQMSPLLRSRRRPAAARRSMKRTGQRVARTPQGD